MLKIIVVDETAEARNCLLDRLQGLIESAGSEIDLLPRINLKPLSRQELKFHEPPHICIIGAGIVRENLRDVGEIRRILPDAALLASLSAETSAFSVIEQLARMGIDDTLLPDTTSAELLRKVVLLARKAKRGRPGKLIVVDSGKGGLGVTTLAAAVADALVSHGSRVTLMDFDVETQDLSRFLQARPFINENLQLLFDEQRPVTQEFVEQCMTRVWEEGKGVLTCISPIEEIEDLYGGNTRYARTLISILEVLDACSNCAVVDAGSARGAILRTLYRVADKVVFVMSNDPAALYASTDRLAQLRSYISSGSEIILVLNNPSPRGLSRACLVEEFNHALGFTAENWSAEIPFSALGQRWPGSGGSLYSQSKAPARKAVDQLLSRLELKGAPAQLAVSLSERSIIFVRRWLARLAQSHATLEGNPAARPGAPVLTSPQLKLPDPRRVHCGVTCGPDRKAFPEVREIDIESLVSPAVIS